MCKLSAVGSKPAYNVIGPAETRFVSSAVSVQSASSPRHWSSSRMFIRDNIGIDGRVSNGHLPVAAAVPAASAAASCRGVCPSRAQQLSHAANLWTHLELD